MVGYGKIFVGRAEETEAHIGEALRLSPRDTLAYTWMGIAGIAKGHLGSWEQATLLTSSFKVWPGSTGGRRLKISRRHAAFSSVRSRSTQATSRSWLTWLLRSSSATTYLLSDDKAARLAAAEDGLNKALSIAPDYAFAHLGLGTVLGWTNRVEQGIAECERALAIDPNLAHAHGIIGMRKAYLGRPADTEGHVEAALRLSPGDAMGHYWLMFVGVAKIYLGRPEEAAEWLLRSMRANRNNPLSHVFLTAVLVLLDKPEEAKAAANAVLALDPKFTIDGLRGFFAFFYDIPINNAGRERIVEGLRKAGLPDNDRRPSRGACRLPAQRRLRRGEAGDRDAEGGA